MAENTKRSSNACGYDQVFEDYPPLTFEEERAMIADCLSKPNGRKLMEDKLVLHNLALAVMKTKKFFPVFKRVWSQDDIISTLVECMYGIVKDFDPDLQVKFSTFMSNMIVWKISRKFNEMYGETEKRSLSADITFNNKEGSEEPIGDFIMFNESDARERLDKFYDRLDKNAAFKFFTMITKNSMQPRRNARTGEVLCRFSNKMKLQIFMLSKMGVRMEDIGNKFGITRSRVGQLAAKGAHLCRQALFDRFRREVKRGKAGWPDMPYYKWLTRMKNSFGLYSRQLPIKNSVYYELVDEKPRWR